MKRTLIRYKTKTDGTEENAHLIEQVFQELRDKMPSGIRYLALRLGDGSFVHLVETEDGATPLPQLASFQAFQRGIAERCAEPPQANEAVIVGNYGMLDR